MQRRHYHWHGDPLQQGGNERGGTVLPPQMMSQTSELSDKVTVQRHGKQQALREVSETLSCSDLRGGLASEAARS